MGVATRTMPNSPAARRITPSFSLGGGISLIKNTDEIKVQGAGFIDDSLKKRDKDNTWVSNIRFLIKGGVSIPIANTLSFGIDAILSVNPTSSTFSYCDTDSKDSPSLLKDALKVSVNESLSFLVLLRMQFNNIFGAFLGVNFSNPQFKTESVTLKNNKEATDLILLLCNDVSD